jgi:oligopeptide transport system permease protein
VSSASSSLASFLGRRLLAAFLVLLAVVSLTFLAIRSAPGSPFVSEKAIPAAVLHQLQVHYRLEGTLGEQYLDYVSGLVRGDLGLAIHYKNRTVAEILLQSFPVSLTIGAVAFVIAMGTGILLGTFAAVRHNRAGDRGAMLLALLGISLPSFVLAPLSILAFGIGLRWLPVAGWGGLRELVLPSICLALPYAAAVARLMRTSLLEVLQHDYVRTARAKGLPEGRVVYVHALKVAILPVITYAGPLAANLMTGSLVVEQIFAIPGIGPFFVNSVLNRDIFLVGGVVLVYSTLLVLFNIVVDVLCAALDKRIRMQ